MTAATAGHERDARRPELAAGQRVDEQGQRCAEVPRGDLLDVELLPVDGIARLAQDQRSSAGVKVSVRGPV